MLGSTGIEDVGIVRAFATGAACQQRTLTPPVTWSCPTLGLTFVLMLRQVSPELVMFPDFQVSDTSIFLRLVILIPGTTLNIQRNINVQRTDSKTFYQTEQQFTGSRYNINSHNAKNPVHRSFRPTVSDPMGTPGFRPRIRPPYPQRVVKGGGGGAPLYSRSRWYGVKQ